MESRGIKRVHTLGTERKMKVWGLCFILIAMGIDPVSGVELTRGQVLFEARCSLCHGLDARGSAKIAKKMKTDPANLDLTRGNIPFKSTKELKKLITLGHGRMPKNSSRLSPEEINDLIQYLRSLQKAFVQKNEPLSNP